MTRGVHWLSIPPGSGYGNAAADYVEGLRRTGVAVRWTPLGWPSTLWPGHPFGPLAGDGAGAPDGAGGRDGAGSPDGAAAGAPDGAGPLVEDVVVHSTPWWDELLRAEAPGTLLALYTTWETDRLGTAAVAILNRYDLVLVPSCFNQEVFLASGVTTPVAVVPHAARDIGAAAGADASDDAQPPEGTPFVFYTIATWSTRKAILDVVDAFTGAFSKDDDVELRIHTTQKDHVAALRAGGAAAHEARAQSWFSLTRALAGRADVPRIVLSTELLSRQAVDDLHRRGHCFVLLSRGEGWGLGAFEAAAFGRPVIVTGWGGTPEFLPAGYPYLVDFDLVPTMTEESDEWWRPAPGERWAKASVAHASALMRHAYEHQDDVRSLGAELRRDVVSSYQRAQVTGRLLRALEEGRSLAGRS